MNEKEPVSPEAADEERGDGEHRQFETGRLLVSAIVIVAIMLAAWIFLA